MDDRTMLELAAKAAGIEWVPANTEKGIELEPVFGLWLKIHGEPYEGQRRRWNPLAADGDALRLAVILGISITPYPIYAEDARHSVLAKQRRRSDTLRETNPTEVIELYRDDPCAATRRAITRAAAEIQLSREKQNG